MPLLIKILSLAFRRRRRSVPSLLGTILLRKHCRSFLQMRPEDNIPGSYMDRILQLHPQPDHLLHLQHRVSLRVPQDHFPQMPVATVLLLRRLLSRQIRQKKGHGQLSRPRQRRRRINKKTARKGRQRWHCSPQLCTRRRQQSVQHEHRSQRRNCFNKDQYS